MVGTGARMVGGYRRTAETVPLTRRLTEKELLVAALKPVARKVTLGVRQLGEIHDRTKRTAEVRERVRNLKDKPVPELFRLAFGKEMPAGTHIRVAFSPYGVVFFLPRKVADKVGVPRVWGGQYNATWGEGTLKGLVAVVVGTKPSKRYEQQARVHEAEHMHTIGLPRITKLQDEFISYVRDGRIYKLQEPETRDLYVKDALRYWRPVEIRKNLKRRIAELKALEKNKGVAPERRLEPVEYAKDPTMPKEAGGVRAERRYSLAGIRRSIASYERELKKFAGRAGTAREETRARLAKQWDENAARVAEAANMMPTDRLANLLSLIPFHLIPKRLPYLVRQYQSKSKFMRGLPLKYA